MKSLETLRVTRLGGSVVRYHTHPTQRSQTVAEHSFGVANLVMYLTEGAASRDLILAAMWHDVSEEATGDVPAPVKWNSPDLKRLLDEIEDQHRERHGLDTELTTHERVILKYADMSELVLWSLEEYMLGNRYARDLIDRGLDYLNSMCDPALHTRYPRTLELYAHLEEEFNNE